MQLNAHKKHVAEEFSGHTITKSTTPLTKLTNVYRKYETTTVALKPSVNGKYPLMPEGKVEDNHYKIGQIVKSPETSQNLSMMNRHINTKIFGRHDDTCIGFEK